MARRVSCLMLAWGGRSIVTIELSHDDDLTPLQNPFASIMRCNVASARRA
jgi:hypothetical protein